MGVTETSVNPPGVENQKEPATQDGVEYASRSSAETAVGKFGHAPVNPHDIQNNLAKADDAVNPEKPPSSSIMDEGASDNAKGAKTLPSEATEAKPDQSSGSGPIIAEDAPALSDSPKSQQQVFFLDPVGTRWSFPYELCRTWNDVKQLIKSVYVDCYLPDRYSELLDEGEDCCDQSFTVSTVKPQHSTVLSSHWEKLVLPGWEFKIEFRMVSDTLHQIRRTKAEGKDKASKNEKEPAPKDKELNKISYVVDFLRLDLDGDWVADSMDTSKRFDNKPKAREDYNIQGAQSILEEHRESYPATGLKADALDLVGYPILYIRSTILLNALKAVINFQSQDGLSSADYRRTLRFSDLALGRFVHPFMDLCHYRERLLEYREEMKEFHDGDYSKACGEHIDALIEYLYEQPAIGLKEAERLLNQKIPKSTFNSLWLILKPGSDVYVEEQGQLNAYVIESVTGGIQWDPADVRALPYSVNVWNLNFDGQFLSRSVKQITIPVFDGEREIKSLPAFPTRFYEDTDTDQPLREKLVERGKRFVEVLRKPTFQEYSGRGKLQGFKEYNRARVVIDHTNQPWKLEKISEDEHAHVPIQSVKDVELDRRTRTPKCPCRTCEANDLRQNTVQRRRFVEYDKIDLSKRKTLTDHEYLLCWSHVYGFVLNDRVWDVLDVACLEEPRIQKNIIDLLVMKPEENKQMIKAICEIYGRSSPHTFSSDFIRGKGEGQIVLLHGPPGTGKTLTAESVAEYTSRPLLSITAADLGHEPEELERNLLRFFRDAAKWNAIVLLDEADVYLEARSVRDLRRNSIVSIFLRALDYFQGILFMTTNRVGSFDEAFMSRIHVQIGYDPLDNASRQQIWDNHFRKLSRNHVEDGQEIRCSYDSKEYVRKSEDLQALRWNGREIRNAFQTAVALACFQAKQEGDNCVPELRDEHLRQVVNMSHNFKNYIKSVRGDDGNYAYSAQLRNDEQKASSNL